MLLVGVDHLPWDAFLMRDGRLTCLVCLSVCLAMVASASAQRSPLLPSPVTSGIDSLLLNASVQKELKLSDAQIQAVKEAVREVRQQQRARLEDLRKLNEENRLARFQDLTRQVSRDLLRRLDKVLSPDQVRRLQQIHVQHQGLQAFADPEVAKALQLTDEQRIKLQAIASEFEAQVEKAFKEDSLRQYSKTLQRLLELRRQTLARALLLLSAPQRDAWRELTGPPFELKLESPQPPRPLTPASDAAAAPRI